jgi:hypothetical protein
MTFSVCKSTDVGAPNITEVAGSLITLLDAVLVNGYGTGLDAKAPLGWTKAFSGTNKAVYKQGAGSSLKYLRVDDTLAYSSNGVNGLLSCASLDDVAGIFTSAASNITIHKPTLVDKFSPLPKWVIVGNEKGFWLFIRPCLTIGKSYHMNYFGDILNTAPNVTEKTMLVLGQNLALGTYGSVDNKIFVGGAGAELSNLKSVNASNGSLPATFTRRGMTAAMLDYPSHAIGTGIAYIGIDISISSGITPVGSLPALYVCPHHQSKTAFLQNWSEVSGSGDYAGKTFSTVQAHYAADPQNSQLYLVEISDTWGI